MAIALALLLVLGIGVLVWRLDQGPIDLPPLAGLIERSFNDASRVERLAIGRVAMAWTGFREGHLSPIDFRLAGVRLVDSTGTSRAELPDATVSLSLPLLLRGVVAPREIELEGLRLTLLRGTDGLVRLDMGQHVDRLPPGTDAPDDTPPEPPGALSERLAALLNPPADSPLAALRSVKLSGGRIAIIDRTLGMSWSLEQPRLALRRSPAGAFDGDGSATVRLGAQNVPVRLTAAARPAEGEAPARLQFDLTIPHVLPAALALANPVLAPLGAFDAPADVTLGAQINGQTGQAEITLAIAAAAGRLRLGQGRQVSFSRLELLARGNESRVRLERARLVLAPVMRDSGGAEQVPPTLTASGSATLADGSWRATLELGLDRLAVPDLSAYWPEGIGGGARGWVLQNITAGIAREGRWQLAVEAPETLDALRVTAASGTLEAEDCTIHWLRPMPPAERTAATITFALTELNVAVHSARLQGSAIEVKRSRLRLFDLGAPRELADIEIAIAGPLADAVTLVRHPRLKLFERRPLDIHDPGGTVEGTIGIKFPLIDDLPAEELQVRVAAKLADIALSDVALGRGIERGAFDLNVSNDGLRLAGNAVFAGIASRIGVEMDFRPGPPGQIVSRERVDARPELRALAGLGLGFDFSALGEGPVGVELRSERRRNGRGDIALRADLAATRLALEPLAWRKPAGRPASAEASFRLQGNALTAIEGIRIEAPELSLRGRAGFGPGTRLERLHITEGALAASRFNGEVTPPPRAGQPWHATLRGAVLDLRPMLAAEQATQAAATSETTGDGMALRVDTRFDRVLLGEGREFTQVTARGSVDANGVSRDAQITGTAGASGFELQITPRAGGRDLRLTAQDAGALLRSFDVLNDLHGGRLTVTGRWEQNTPGARLAGSAEMTDFALRNAPAMGKLLQALTLFGMFDALSGPGLNFTQLTAPFTLTRQVLELDDARAFSASLGLTARGWLDRRNKTLDMQGTIVPAYVFNTVLGRIPLIGRLFSPEAGGGMFAATYRLRGTLADPEVSVNPLAALTPGFLRGIFGAFEPPVATPGR